MHNWILFQTVTNSNAEFGSERRKKLKTKENSIRAEEFSFDKIKNSYENFVVKVEEKKEEMRKWILFRTVTNSDGEFGTKR